MMHCLEVQFVWKTQGEPEDRMSPARLVWLVDAETVNKVPCASRDGQVLAPGMSWRDGFKKGRYTAMLHSR